MTHPTLRAGLLAATLATGAGSASAQFEGETLYLFNWSQYMDPAIIEQFEDRYGVDVVRNYFNSNGELFAKLQAGGDSQYDVIVPSNYYVPRLINSDLVQPLDHTQLPNLDNLMESFVRSGLRPG